VIRQSGNGEVASADRWLEAAHILPDGHPLGEPVIPNGLALCKLHHAAFDRYLIGVTPDLEVTVRLDVRAEIDGPMLQHGLQGFQGRRIHVPRADHLEPNRGFLAERYAPLPPRELSHCILDESVHAPRRRLLRCRENWTDEPSWARC
jgi:predicted restriction endonuclease